MDSKNANEGLKSIMDVHLKYFDSILKLYIYTRTYTGRVLYQVMLELATETCALSFSVKYNRLVMAKAETLSFPT